MNVLGFAYHISGRIGQTPRAVTSLVIEDGSGVKYANSYVSYEAARAYAKARGKESLFLDREKAEAALVDGGDYLNVIEFSGLPVFTDQDMNWPRSGVYINGVKLADDSIPKDIRSAQIEVAIAVASGLDVFGETSGRFVVREKVGPIEKEYSDKIGFGEVDLSYVDALLSKYIYGGWGLRTVRI